MNDERGQNGERGWLAWYKTPGGSRILADILSGALIIGVIGGIIGGSDVFVAGCFVGAGIGYGFGSELRVALNNPGRPVTGLTIGSVAGAALGGIAGAVITTDAFYSVLGIGLGGGAGGAIGIALDSYRSQSDGGSSPD